MAASTVFRDAQGRVLPGSVMNPAGRPKSKRAFGDSVRRGVDPDEMRDILLAIARGQGVRVVMAADGKGVIWQEAAPPTYKERIQAAKELLKYGFSPATADKGDQGPELAGGQDISKMSPEALAAYGQLLQLIGTGAVDPVAVLAAGQRALPAKREDER
jgi:hypothetical protein